VRRRTALALVAVASLGLAACRGSSSATGNLTDYCAAIVKLRDTPLIPDDITDRQAVADARRTLDDLAKLAPSDIATEIDVLRRAMTAIGNIDYTKPAASDQIEKVLNDQNVDDAAGKVGQFTETACGAATPSSDAAGQ
jgi:phage FluMu protein gp41